MRLFLLPVLLCTLYLNTALQLRPEEFKLKGTVFGKSTYHGGIAYDDSKTPALPLPNYTICLTQWHAADSIPVFVTRITTDKNGEFETCLPPGQFGFATPAELDSLQPGQWLPRSQEKWSGHNLISSSWQCSSEGPIDLRNGDISTIQLTFNQSTICIDCP